MKPGYSRAVVNENIAQQCREGVPLRIAIRRALDHARQEYRAKKPNGMLPYHLRLPEDKARTNQHYRKNPAVISWEKAFQLWKQYKTSDPRYQEFAAHHGYTEGALNSRFASENARKRNPVPPSSRVQIKEAAQLYADFSGHEPEIIGELDKPVIPDVLIGIGEVDGILYSTVRDGVLEKYVHRFAKKARPLFAVSHDGKQLFMLGGAYNFTERGIVDET